LTLSFTRQWEGLSHQIVECPSDFGDPESFPEIWQVNNFPSRPKMGPIENRLDVTDKAPQVRAYMRIVPEFSDNPVWRAAQRAALTDGPAAITALRYHGLPLGSQASLDHQAWFHRPLSFDGWHVYDLFSDIAVGNRALVHGRIWDEQGNLHATVMQEVTYRRPDA
jgi:acyl-CoA thioesterase II